MPQAQARLRNTIPRHRQWQRVFGDEPLPLLIDKGPVDNSVLVVDTESLEPVRYQKLVQFCAEQWRMPLSQVSAFLDFGFPIAGTEAELIDPDLARCV